MRCVPVAIAQRRRPDRLVRDTADTCAVTHYAPACQWSCVIVNSMVAVLLSGNIPDLVRLLGAAKADGCPDLLATGQASGIPTSLLSGAIAGKPSPDDTHWMRGNRGAGGHTVLTMQAGLWAATTPLSFEEALVSLVNAGAIRIRTARWPAPCWGRVTARPRYRCVGRRTSRKRKDWLTWPTAWSAFNWEGHYEPQGGFLPGGE